MTHPVWNARCKGGYEFKRGKRWKPCRRVCRRGELLCGDCLEAVVLDEAVRLPLMARLKALAGEMEISLHFTLDRIFRTI